MLIDIYDFFLKPHGIFKVWSSTGCSSLTLLIVRLIIETAI